MLARNLATLLLLGTTPVLSAQSGKGAPTPRGAVEQFMTAIHDSNLVRAAELFGNAKGSAARTHLPVNYEKRMITIQLMLRRVQAKALSDVPGAKGGVRLITTQLTSNGCKVVLPVNVVESKEGWLVQEFDLEHAAQVNRPCDPAHGGNGNK